MNFNKQKTNAIFSILIIFSIISGNLSYQAQDLVSSDDISGGSGVFVFRQSKFKPQFKSAARSNFLRNIPLGPAITGARRPPSKKVNINTGLAKRNEIKRKNAVAAKNNLSNTLTAKADNLLKNKSTDKAVTTYQEALKINPQNQDAKLGLSRAFAAKGDEILQTTGTNANNKSIDEAVANYEKALAINPELPGLYLQIANINYQKGDFSRAEDYLVKAEKTADSNSETETLRGLINLKQNENNAALANFTKAINLDPKNAVAYFYQAGTYDRLNLDQDAVKAYQKSIEIDPKFTAAWFDLAVMNYNKGAFKEAVSLYKQVIALDKNDAAAHANMASAYRQLEKYAEANSEYKIAAEYIKDDADLFSEWGFCLGKVAEWDKAIARLQTARDLSPQAIDYTNLGWAYFNAAQKDLDNKNRAGAQTKLNLGKQILQKAVELDPKSEAAWLNLGATYARSGEYQNAVNALNKANSLHPKWAFGINELGLAYRSFNKYSEAISQFQKAINLDEKFATGYFNLGEAQYKNGKKKDAQKTLEKLRQLSPGLAAKLEVVMKGNVNKEEN